MNKIDKLLLAIFAQWADKDIELEEVLTQIKQSLTKELLRELDGLKEGDHWIFCTYLDNDNLQCSPGCAYPKTAHNKAIEDCKSKLRHLMGVGDE